MKPYRTTKYYNPRAHRFTKLDEDKVRAIRSDPRSSLQVAKAYGVTHSTVSEIRRYRAWKWVQEIDENFKDETK